MKNEIRNAAFVTMLLFAALSVTGCDEESVTCDVVVPNFNEDGSLSDDAVIACSDSSTGLQGEATVAEIRESSWYPLLLNWRHPLRTWLDPDHLPDD